MAASALTLRTGDLVVIRAERWRVARQVTCDAVTVLDVCGCGHANAGAHASFLLPFEHLERIDTTRAPRVVRPARWRRHARRVLARATPDARALRAAAGADVTVMPFQLEPALAVTHGLGCRLLLADAVGLGKTIQAGLVLAEIHHRMPGARALVVVPAGLREQWQQELHRRFGMGGVILDAAVLARTAADPAAGANPWAAHPLVIVSIDYVKRPEVIRALEAVVWDAVVFDEAHALASRSDRATAASLLAARARTVILLTATPHDGSDEAFARLCGIGALGAAFPLLLFRRTREDVGIPAARRMVWLRVRLGAAERALHDALAVYARRLWTDTRADPGTRLAIGVLMRRASSSAASLASSLERRLASLDTGADATASQLALPFTHMDADDEPVAVVLAPGLRDREEERAHLRHLIGLARQVATGESKTTAILRLLRRTRERAIVFTEYRDTLAHLADRLHHLDVVQLHGGMTRTERQAVLAQFTSRHARLLLATDTASEGLNLHHHCRLVIHLELPWTPLRLEQRVGRVERIGQTRRVHAVHLIAQGTAEETVAAHLNRRRRRMRQAIDALRAREVDAAVVLGIADGAPAPEAPRAATPPVPEGVVVPNLRAIAGREAGRLQALRPLRDRPSPARPDQARDDAGAPFRFTRPVVALLGRRRTRTVACYWVFVHDVTDADGRLLWEEIIALAASGAHQGRRATDVRRLLGFDNVALTEATARAAITGRAAAGAALATWIALSSRREHAVRDAIVAYHARLSAPLLQRGLFDRRAELQAAAQAAIRDEAVARCHGRLAQLERARMAVSTGCEPLFAVAVAR